VLLSWEGAVKLADFGLARMIQRTLIPGANARGGTPGYLSPEQARREDLDGRSDLYAVGIVLWELLASRRLRAGLPGDTSAKITFAAIQPPSEHRPVPADLETVAMRLLAYDPAERCPTAELAARDLVRCQDASRDGRGDLVRLLEERFPRARRPGAVEQQDSQCVSGTSDPSRQRWALAFVVLALVLGAAISILVLW
jgi:serine/threonine protein kinase